MIGFSAPIVVFLSEKRSGSRRVAANQIAGNRVSALKVQCSVNRPALRASREVAAGKSAG